jgi:chromosome segregation ATPase
MSEGYKAILSRLSFMHEEQDRKIKKMSTELSHKANEAEAQREKMRTEREALKATLQEQFNAQREEQDRKINELEEQLEKICAERDRTIKEMSTEREALRASLQELEAQCNDQQSFLEQARITHDVVGSELKNLDQQRASLQEEKAKLQSEFDKIKTANSRLVKESNEQKTEIKRLTNIKRSSVRQIAEKDKTIAALQREISEVRRLFATVGSESNAKQDEINALRTEITKRDETIDELRSTVAEVESAVAAVADESNARQNEIFDLRRANLQLREAIYRLNKRTEKPEIYIAVLRAINENQTEQINVLESRVRELEAELQQQRIQTTSEDLPEPANSAHDRDVV